jgi:hypothetical protein
MQCSTPATYVAGVHLFITVYVGPMLPQQAPSHVLEFDAAGGAPIRLLALNASIERTLKPGLPTSGGRTQLRFAAILWGTTCLRFYLSDYVP